jgi:acetolactate synthase I/II/III large subunit
MAEGYARVTGKPGVLLVTSGPGATNLVTPLADALMDGTPLVALTGQVATGAIGTDAFQEADVVGITRPCTKWNTLVKDVRDIPRAIKEAFVSAAGGSASGNMHRGTRRFGRDDSPAPLTAACLTSPTRPALPAPPPPQAIATSGRPGPVLVDLPKDVTAAKLTVRPDVAPRVAQRMAEKAAIMNMEQGLTPELTARLAKLINGAKRPVIYAGQGVIGSGAVAQLREFAERGNIPVTTTLLGECVGVAHAARMEGWGVGRTLLACCGAGMLAYASFPPCVLHPPPSHPRARAGMGSFDETDARSLHMLGMHGSVYANYAMQVRGTQRGD